MKTITKISLGAVGGLFVLGAASAILSTTTTAIVHDAATKPSTTTSTDVGGGTDSSTADSGQAHYLHRGQQIAACIASSGHGDAAQRLQMHGGGIFGSTDIYTSLTGGMAGPDQGAAQLIVSAFIGCITPGDGSGLVTVYDAGGNIMANGNY